MTRQRLRPAYGADELGRVYPRPHDSGHHPDHGPRIAVTAVVARVCTVGARSAADLSCGDGLILSGLDVTRKVFGDLAPGYEVTGPLESTLQTLDPVDVYVCTETLEHLDDPGLVLRLIRARTRRMVLSTPVDAWADTNPEHYWAWSRADVEEMLAAAGFKAAMYAELDMRPGGSDYAFGIWGCL